MKSLFDPARERGSSQRTLAKVVGRDASVISRYFSGEIVAPREFVDSMVTYLSSLRVQVTEQQVENAHALRRAAQKLSDQNEARFEYLNEHIAALRRQMDLHRAQFSEENRRLRDQRDALVRGEEQHAYALAAREAGGNARVEELSRALAAAAEEIGVLKESLGSVTARLEEKGAVRGALAELVVRQQGQLEHAGRYSRGLEADLASALVALQALEQEVLVLRRQVTLLMEEPRPAAGAADAPHPGAGVLPAGGLPYASSASSPLVTSDACDATQVGGGERQETAPAPPGEGRAAARRSTGLPSGASSLAEGRPGSGGSRPQGPWGVSAAESAGGDPVGVPVAPCTGETVATERRRTGSGRHAPATGLRTRRGRKIGQAVTVLACAGFLAWWVGDSTVGDFLPWIDRAAATHGPGPSPTPTPTPTSSPSPSPSETPVIDSSTPHLSTAQVLALPACTNDRISLGVVAPNEVGGGSDVRIQVTLTLLGSGPACRIDISHDALVLTITDTAGKAVWRSSDCAPVLPPRRWARLGDEPVTATITWNQHTSTPDCPTDIRPVPPGTYLAEASSTQVTVRSSLIIG
ncbi:hypothetical protein [Streptomyces nojiriensis]|uniref:hypothetical protein n=1 Tax=Streptomyces nojiriensis TaxID=66374 RepID=UPI0016758600|nr:hypothetical protein [Streptomyces nojiriensis]